jgi:hypothetical protein
LGIGDGIRRNVATISDEERCSLRNAIIELNKKFYAGKRDDSIVGGVSYWFKQDEIHQATHVHGGPAFLPWHRELCNRFEKLLREVDSELSLHYWDWTSDPRKSPDGKGGFVNLFCNEFMGNDYGEAGKTWKDNNFYDPKAKKYRSDFEFDYSHSNPFDPPAKIERYVNSSGGGKIEDPNLRYKEDQILKAETFPEMRYYLEYIHNQIHNYIGGTIGDPHTSFRDPFVFLLHSNVDRIFAAWQKVPNKEWRFDPDKIYGSESNTQNKGIFPEIKIGILASLQPWSGINAPGTEEGAIEIRPWSVPENQQEYKTSRDPSIVNPPKNQ